MDAKYWIRSELFKIQPDEDKETNPGRYGKELGQWLCRKLKTQGYEDAELIAEDWGWCVMCKRENYLLWVGCGSILPEISSENLTPAIPQGNPEIVWHVFTEVEVPFFFFKSNFLKFLGKLDTRTVYEKLNRDLKQILEQEPGIRFCEGT
ncbi:hypothetical protein [Undibacterium sp. TS12]|uniref:hypothetical protein n=1 Tax=Undibacterium sp. TS12 TaxID=2908202 RepID=UPI001F4C9834|nr:hypothetical protein [Undibacterium sp. TS12]MCH8622235.1 hypothetical protein [Undibacterium sp. TS12]